MDIRKMSDDILQDLILTRLADDVDRRGISRASIISLAHFIRQCVKDSQKELVEAVKIMIRTHGMHGPCENNTCRDCTLAYTKAKQALASVEGKDSHVA